MRSENRAISEGITNDNLHSLETASHQSQNSGIETVFEDNVDVLQEASVQTTSGDNTLHTL